MVVMITKSSQRRMARERKTFTAMLAMFCHDQHGTATGLCASCEQLQAYALERSAHCPFQADKPTCLQCPVHCYQPEMRARVRDVMRYAGPKMPLRHPLLALLHLWTSRRPPSHTKH